MNDAPPETIRISDETGFHVPHFLSTSVSRAADRYLANRLNPAAEAKLSKVTFRPHTPEEAAAFRARQAAAAATPRKRQPVYAHRRTAVPSVPAVQTPAPDAPAVCPDSELPRRAEAGTPVPASPGAVEMPVVRPPVPARPEPVPSRARVPDPAPTGATPRLPKVPIRRRRGHPSVKSGRQRNPTTNVARILDLVKAVGPVTSVVASIMLGLPRAIVAAEMDYLACKKKLVRLVRANSVRRGGRPWIYDAAPGS
jgi:hypothetical protein